MSSCGSMPAVGVPVTLRILSAPEPREHSPRSCTASIIATECFASIWRIWIFALGEIGEPRELLSLQDAVRQPQAAHVGILVGRDVEQPKETPAKIIRRLRILVSCRVGL